MISSALPTLFFPYSTSNLFFFLSLLAQLLYFLYNIKYLLLINTNIVLQNLSQFNTKNTKLVLLVVLPNSLIKKIA